MSRRKKKSNRNGTKVNKYCKEKDKKSIKVIKRTEVARRYEEFHTRFLNYEQIIQFLVKMSKAYPKKVRLTDIGTSTEGRNMYLVIVSGTNIVANPKSGVLLQAGMNGRDWMAVSNTLFIIEYLVKNENAPTRVMDFYIIPCINPDGYEYSFRQNQPRYCDKKKDANEPKMNLENNFPMMLGLCNASEIPTSEFLAAIQIWKENYVFGYRETCIFLNVIYTFQFTIKLFISLQEGGESILYPYGLGKMVPADIEDLHQIAVTGKKGIRCRRFQYGTIFNLCGLNFGNILDFLRIQQNMMPFSYIIQVVNQSTENDTDQILEFGEDIMNCVKLMTAAVFKFYNKTEHAEDDLDKSKCTSKGLRK